MILLRDGSVRPRSCCGIGNDADSGARSLVDEGTSFLEGRIEMGVVEERYAGGEMAGCTGSLGGGR